MCVSLGASDLTSSDQDPIVEIIPFALICTKVSPNPMLDTTQIQHRQVWIGIKGTLELVILTISGTVVNIEILTFIITLPIVVSHCTTTK